MKWFYRLPARLLDAFYDGSGRIASFRSELAPGSSRRASEDWIGAVVSPFGAEGAQLAEVEPGRSLKECIASDPGAWLGNVRGTVPLVKLLDTGQRIPVHVHPDDEFARTSLGMANGKSENWIVVRADEGACAYVGWREDMSLEEVSRLVDEQDVQGMLDRMQKIHLSAGDSIFVPASIPHSIGEGMLVNEVQQSADASCLLEYAGYATGSPADSFVGLDRSSALEMVTLAATSHKDIESWICRNVLDAAGSMIVPAAESYFTAHCLTAGSTRPARFGICLVLAGCGSVNAGDESRGISVGDAFVVPYSAGPLTFDGGPDLRVAAFGQALASAE